MDTGHRSKNYKKINTFAIETKTFDPNFMKIGSRSKVYISLTGVPEWAFRYWGHNVGINLKKYQSESKIYT